MSNDTISRQAAKEAYCKHFCHRGAACPDTLCKEVNEAFDELPSAQPEQIWILCDERMPEEHEWIGTKKFGTTKSDEVYVTFENPKGERFCRHLCFQNGELSNYDKQLIDAWFKGSKPIAWMPLPEPWNGGKETRWTK